MNHRYEQKLSTEPMLPLIFKMALPAVAAQLVNLLYCDKEELMVD